MADVQVEVGVSQVSVYICGAL